MVRAGIYARISSDRDGDHLAITRQLADCRQLAERKRWQVVEQYVDSDISAWGRKPRPQYLRLLDDIDAGVLDAVLVYHADRLHRHPRELEDFIDLCNLRKIKMATVSGDIDLSTHEGQLLARITGAVARKESDDKSRRIRRKHEEIALAGRPSGGGTRPYGYESDRLTVRPSEAVVIRDCARRVLAGDSLRAITIDLNARAVPSASGGKWSSQTLRRLLLSGRISGQREHHGEIVAPGVWPAIITPEQTTRLRAKLGDPERRFHRSARRYLLSRALKCGHCGSKLYARPRNDGVRRYVCASGPIFGGCGKITIVADPVEAFVTEAVLHRIESPAFAKSRETQLDDPQAATWQAEFEQAQQQLDELAAMWGRREITNSEWIHARGPIEQRQAVAKKRLAALNRATVLIDFSETGAELRASWQTLTLTRQQQIIAAVLQHVVVGPARKGFNRFDPSRLRPVWRV